MFARAVKRWRLRRGSTLWSLYWIFVLAIFAVLVLFDVWLFASRAWILGGLFAAVAAVWGKRALLDSGFVRFVLRRGRERAKRR